jgi:hypothetical protein
VIALDPVVPIVSGVMEHFWEQVVDDQRGEVLHPPVDGDVINIDATLGEQFFDVSVRQSVAELPAHCQ